MENEHGNSFLLAGCFNGCYRRHSARSVSIFRNIHRCGFFFKNIQKTTLTTRPACGILCVTGLATLAKAEAAAVTGDDSSEKIIANCLLGRLGRIIPGVSFATLLTQSPLFRALASAGKVTERPQQKEAENDVRPVSGPVSGSAPGLPHLNPDRRSFAADHPRRGEYRPRREEAAPKLSFRRSGSDEGRIARAGRDARSVIQGGTYL